LRYQQIDGLFYFAKTAADDLFSQQGLVENRGEPD